METQSASAVLLVRPAAFGFNDEAAESNVFAHASADPQFAARALSEFEMLADRLAGAGVEVAVLDDTPSPAKPDALFPNNWLSFHCDGTMVLYPMATAPRRLERRATEVGELLEGRGFEVRRIVELSGYE
ncbi:MAG TPA: arginine deiminase-related protein, partial [Sphingomicrobium sp.]|nr:arginine deiminase-related protein [Sphingomicrobium sp.]